jgi:cytochrome P450
VPVYTSFDHNDPSLTAAAIRELHGEMRESCPVAHSDQHGGFDVLTRYADVRQALASAASFSSADGVFIPPSGAVRVPALEFDDPEHATWRAIMGPPLTIRAVRALEPTIGQVTDQLIDEFAGRGHADLVSELAEPLPSLIVGRMVGLDAEHSLAARKVAAAMYASIGRPDFAARYADFGAFVEAQLADRRQYPQDDFLTQVASGAVDGVPVDSDGATGLMVAYLLGGHHSTGSGIAGLLHHILTGPGLQARLMADPGLMPQAVEESLRLNTPLQYFARTARADTEVAGEPIAAGRRVLLDLAGANRDPRTFGCPEAFDLDRGRNPHVAFGGGAHICQGQHLARAELRIAAQRLLARLPGVRIAGPCEEVFVGGKLITFASLPVTFTAEPQGGLAQSSDRARST